MLGTHAHGGAEGFGGNKGARNHGLRPGSDRADRAAGGETEERGRHYDGDFFSCGI